jgi:hypothetical protein
VVSGDASLPTTLAASDSDGGKGAVITFQRIIVHPDGHREAEGKRPKQLPAPVQALPDASHMLPRTQPNDIKNLDE